MYSIALLCEVGASTGMVVRHVRAAADELGIEVEVRAHPYSQIDLVLDAFDYVLLGPQLKFRLASARAEHPGAADRIDVVAPRDFATMDGKRILAQAMTAIDALRATGRKA